MDNKTWAQACEAGKWYQHEFWERVLCCGKVNEKDGVMFVVQQKPAERGLLMLQGRGEYLAPLPDCTGWDWQPPPKYRPFRDAWEFVESAKGRRIACQSGTMEITAVDFEEHPLCVNICGGWYSLKALCDQFIFEDTGSPCGVRL